MNAQEQRERMRRSLPKEPACREWISYLEAERYSGLSHSTLYRYVIAGQLKAAKVGKSVRVHFPALKAFMEERAGGGRGDG